MQLVEITWSAPVVIGYRTAQMMTSEWLPSARDRREYMRWSGEGPGLHLAYSRR
jgi:hypothetical protein